MSVTERNFATYELGDDPRLLADGLLLEIGHATGYAWTASPTEEDLAGLVGHIGPEKWLQANIGLVQEHLRSSDDAVTVAADWTDRSGILTPMHRSFAYAEIAVPEEFDTATFNSAVARWMLRRANHLKELTGQGIRVGGAVIVAGSREMKATESPFVEDYAHLHGKLPTEAQFANYALKGYLEDAGIDTEIIAVDSEKGDELVRVSAEAIGDSGTVLAVANAPAAIQVAGQYRLAARELYPGFDARGEQLFMSSDKIDVARHGEPPATHQNPFTALGQIARSGLFLGRNAL